MTNAPTPPLHLGPMASKFWSDFIAAHELLRHPALADDLARFCIALEKFTAFRQRAEAGEDGLDDMMGELSAQIETQGRRLGIEGDPANLTFH